jgi:iron(III) transport system ATP-binding protein
MAQVASGSLVLNQVSKVFEQGRSCVRSVDQVSLEILEGEFLTVLGPSGCGKTTLLRLIAGFEFPQGGCILLDGKDLSDVPANKRPMAMVFQNYALFPHLNVFENIAFGLKLKSSRKSEIWESVEIVLHMMNLAGLEKRSPHQLSGGQQQRVALARAMVMQPRLLLFDEPLSNLDAKLRAQMRVEIRHLQQRLGTTSIYVTHDQTEALNLSDRIVVMNQGRVEQIGTPEEIYQRPASLFVADFIGRANFVEARVRECQNGCATVELFGRNFQLPCSPQIKPNCDAFVVIRPEAIKLAEPSNDETGEVKTAIYFGSQVEYQVETDSNRLMVIDNDPQSARIFRAGSRVAIVFDPSRCYVLPHDNLR